MTYDCDIYHTSIVLCDLCDITSHPSSRSKIKKSKIKIKNKRKNRKVK